MRGYKVKLFFILVFSLFSLEVFTEDFQGTEVTSREQTEAGSPDDTIRTSDICCDREYTQGWAQEISEQESRAIVNRVLPTSEGVKPGETPADQEGQR